MTGYASFPRVKWGKGLVLLLMDLVGGTPEFFEGPKLLFAYKHLRWVWVTITEREALCLRLRYWQGLTLREMGMKLGGISPERVRQILLKTHRKLRHSTRFEGWKEIYAFWYAVKYRDEAPEVIRAWNPEAAIARWLEMRRTLTGGELLELFDPLATDEKDFLVERVRPI